ncbi:hypothetical protein HH214_02275 [Mucilaginibacter robiniae]|uniref:Outer membrane protein beta-barrel domain-containing protein n=1 Tax=Mucilaginibacter robiniae TaxID=2728022 RepID=A0A7L5DZS9_9SPHI|nr:hypothetical protein [Mucilaginibacter robiniae]QJD94784.1 hypothetical protein HH214_02275 [Mucilaginibacter robiniae]
MSEQPDNELSKRISEVFDHYEEDTMAADAGWELLRQKYPPQQKRRGAFWIWPLATAALLLLFCLTGIWFYQKQATKSNLAHTKPTRRSTMLSTAKSQDSLDHISATLTDHDYLVAHHHPTTIHKNTPAQTEKPSNDTGQPYTLSPQNSYTYKNNAVDSGQSHPISQLNLPPVNTQVAIAQTGKKPISKSEIPMAALLDSSAKVNQQLIVQKTIPPTIGKKDSAVAKATSKPSIYTLFEQDEKNNNTKSKLVKKENTSKRVLYSVYAATYFNYAKGSSNQVNAGAGFTSDIRLSGKLKLSTGLAIGQNSLSYNGLPSQGNLAAAAIAAAPVIANTTVNSLTSSFPVSRAAVSTVKRYQANFTGLDIPINLKYEFNSHSDTYIAAGLSSGTFITENYRYQYANPVSFSTSNTQTTTEVTTRTNFSRFDIAHVLNLSFGVGYRLGSNRIIIEPFLKYPLDGLGSQQIQFGAGGVNLKFKFQSHKK